MNPNANNTFCSFYQMQIANANAKIKYIQESLKLFKWKEKQNKFQYCCVIEEMRIYSFHSSGKTRQNK